MEPELVDWDIALLLELIRPLSSVLVLDVLPFRSDTLLEQMIIRLECEF